MTAPTTIGPGYVAVTEPGHDSWLIGDEPWIMCDTGVAVYARAE